MNVFLSPLAEFKLNLILEYLASEWGEKSKKKFLSKLEASINQISEFPESNQKTEELGGFYKCVVTKQTSLFYRITDDEIEVITVIDNRQDPKSIIEEIRRHFT